MKLVKKVLKKLKNPEEEKPVEEPEPTGDELRIVDVPSGSGKPISAVKFIKSYLVEHKESSIYDVYHDYKVECERMGIEIRGPGKGYKPASYKSIRLYIYILRKYGIVRDVRREPAGSAWIKHQKKIIELVEGQEEHPIWDDLWKYVKSQGKGEAIPVEDDEEE